MSKAKVRVPSAQHLVKNLHDRPEFVQRALVQNALNPPRKSYKPLHKATLDVSLKVPLQQIEQGIRRVERRPTVADDLVKLVGMIEGHFSPIVTDFPPMDVECRHYSVGRGLRIPFQPPLCYYIGGELYLPWFMFWMRNPLVKKKLSYFLTILDEIREQEPDLEDARVQILDFSVPDKAFERSLLVIAEDDIPRATKDELTDALEIFTYGFFRAQLELANRTDDPAPSQPPNDPDDQPDLFGDDGKH